MWVNNHHRHSCIDRKTSDILIMDILQCALVNFQAIEKLIGKSASLVDSTVDHKNSFFTLMMVEEFVNFMP